eukprot:CAMPEP_0114547900 /NCGR_PEP_ID=MMETSP0114-20121206/4700_1 /TAXON_ID=31324 /ORGANISM="Goniomonas sp, Strain m" /LENGTH=479 /DNA_ID=CAMNT_0001732465 /DNA_START=59 /DNA_END=1495 /DNA_ORIENTATION=+
MSSNLNCLLADDCLLADEADCTTPNLLKLLDLGCETPDTERRCAPATCHNLNLTTQQKRKLARLDLTVTVTDCAADFFAALHKGKTVVSGEFGGVYAFDENAIVPNGDQGYFGKVRFGTCCLAPNRSAPQLNCDQPIVLKELLLANRSSLVFSPRSPPWFSKVTQNNLKVYQPGEEVTLEHLRLFRAPDVRTFGGATGDIIAMLVDRDGELVVPSLSHMISIYGIDGDAQNVSEVPTAYSEYLKHRRWLRQEVEASRRIPIHDNLLPVYDIVEHISDNTARTFLVLPHCSGGDLLDYLTDNRPDEAEARALFRQVVSALAALHAEGLCHRDLKTDNLFIDSNGTLRLGDYGLCGDAGECHARVGSPTIVAPEVLAHGTEPNVLKDGGCPTGQGYNGAAADCWSLGVVLFNLLAHSDAFFYAGKSSNWSKLGTAVPGDAGFRLLVDGQARLPDKVAVGARDLLLALLQPSPERRMSLEDV